MRVLEYLGIQLYETTRPLGNFPNSPNMNSSNSSDQAGSKKCTGSIDILYNLEKVKKQTCKVEVLCRSAHIHV